MTPVAMMVVGFAVAMFGTVGAVIAYGERQTARVMRKPATPALPIGIAKTCSGAGCVNKTCTRLRNPALAA